MFITDFKSRTHKIFEAIIQAYAETGAPVGSEYLLSQYHFHLSAATIRSVMADLEDQGLLTHPHTSAGRVPTDLGYRYYVDLLLQPKRLSPEEEGRLGEFSRIRFDQPHDLLEEATRLLSEMTRAAGIVLIPQLAEGSFQHLQLIPVDQRGVVGVLIASEGFIKHAKLELEEPVDEDELIRIERFLNQELAGMPLSQVDDYLERTLLEASSALLHLYKRASELLSLKSFFDEGPSLILEGASAVLEAPEFQDMERTRRLLRGLEEKEDLLEILRRDRQADHVKFHIGSENKETSLVDCTICAAPYRLRGGVMGSLGVLGPTRMDYPRVSALVGRAAQVVTRAFEL